MSRRIPGILAAVLTAAVALTVAGCSNTPTASPAAPSASATTPAPTTIEHDPADVSFVQSMIPHHSQAISMAEQAATRADSVEVKDLAGRIDAAQGPEIEQMKAMLTSWSASTVAPSATAMPGTAPRADGMAGMMTDAQMTQLAGLSGPAFDRMFLQMMIGHHSGAITMSRTELAQGLSPQAKTLANSIIADQQREIGEMHLLLGRG